MFYVNPSDPTPLYAQLTRAIQFAIATGKLRIGEQLPTVRQLAVDLRINMEERSLPLPWSLRPGSDKEATS